MHIISDRNFIRSIREKNLKIKYGSPYIGNLYIKTSNCNVFIKSVKVKIYNDR